MAEFAETAAAAAVADDDDDDDAAGRLLLLLDGLRLGAERVERCDVAGLDDSFPSQSVLRATTWCSSSELPPVLNPM